jgi:hypothetical protein
MPFPVELLRFFEHATATEPETEAEIGTETVADPPALLADPAAPIADSAAPIAIPPAAAGLPEPLAPSGNGSGPDRR